MIPYGESSEGLTKACDELQAKIQLWLPSPVVIIRVTHKPTKNYTRVIFVLALGCSSLAIAHSGG